MLSLIGFTPGGHQQNETCTCYNREARRLQQNTTWTCHVRKNEQNRPVNTRRLLCPCDCLDLLLLSHDGLSENKHEDPVSPYAPQPSRFGLHAFDVQTWLALPPIALHPYHATKNRWPHVCLASHGHPAAPTSQGQELVHCAFVPDGSSSSGASSSSKSKMVCTLTSLSKFGNISCARLVEEPVLDHKITVFLRLMGAVGASTRADACAFSGEPQLPRAR